MNNKLKSDFEDQQSKVPVKKEESFFEYESEFKKSRRVRIARPKWLNKFVSRFRRHS